MSLANKLLFSTNDGIMTESVVIDDINNIANECHAFVSDDIYDAYTDIAIETLLTDIYNVDKAFLTADIIAEVQVIREGTDPAVLLEAISKSGFTKIKEAFKKFWAKLKAWFNEIKRQFQIIFLKGKDFIKRFKQEITAKDPKDFTYKGKKYDFAKGKSAGDGIFNAVKNKIDTVITIAFNDSNKSDIATDKESLTSAVIGRNVSDADLKMSSTDIQDNFIKGLDAIKGASDISELTEKLYELYRSGNEPDETDEYDFSTGNDRDEMIVHVNGYEKAVKDIETNEKNFDTLMNKIITSLNKYERKYGDDDNEGSYAKVQYASRLMTAMLAVGKVPSTVQQAIYKEAESQYESVLKQFLRWKPAKEGVGVDDEDDSVSESISVGNSLLESAYSMLNI